MKKDNRNVKTWNNLLKKENVAKVIKLGKSISKYKEDLIVPENLIRFERIVNWEDRIASYPETTRKIYIKAFEKMKIL